VESVWADFDQAMTRLRQAQLPERRTARLRHAHRVLHTLLVQLRHRPYSQAEEDQFLAAVEAITTQLTQLLDDHQHTVTQESLLTLEVLRHQLDPLR
jgi:hypothetical protein